MKRISPNRPIADIQGCRHGVAMDDITPLSAPQLREELRSYLTELATDDPRRIWQKERLEGLSSGIDDVFHFFFDDHDFDESNIGRVFFDHAEVAAVGGVKSALEALLPVVGTGGDNDFIQDRLWPNVTNAARVAQLQLNAAC